MRSLSEFESNLNHILRMLLGASSVEENAWLLTKEHERPKCLSRDCVDLVQDTLAKGCTRYFASRGWKLDRVLHEGEPKSGRLWQRYSLDQLGLRFSRNTMRLLIWLTAENVGHSKRSISIRDEQLTVGDRILHFIAINTLAKTNSGTRLVFANPFKSNPLTWFFQADLLAGKLSGIDPRGDNPMTAWFKPNRTWFLEALQQDLAARWADLEIEKRIISDPKQLAQVAETQQRALTFYLDAADATDRRDLALWLLESAEAALRNRANDEKWFRNLNLKRMRVVDRQSLYLAAMCVFHAIDRLSHWHDESLQIGFYDEDYQASQLWKSRWEAMDGDRIRQASRELIQSLAPLGA